MLVKWLLRLIGACGMVGIVHAFMVGFAVPQPDAWYLGAMIYAGLVAVLFSRKSLIDKLGIYFVFVVVTIVGALTVCPCTQAHFFIGPLAGLMAIGLIHGIKRLLQKPVSMNNRQALSTAPPRDNDSTVV